MPQPWMIDIHAHILPGVDDGAQSWEETEALLCMASAQGIRCIIATPHFSRRLAPERLRELRERTQELARRKGLALELELGQEIRYFEELPEYLEAGRALTLAGSRYVLVEFGPADGFTALYRAIRELVQAGWLPVIAHVERYDCLREKGRPRQLVEAGAYLQVNAGSLLGGLLHSTAAWCRREILNGTIYFIATDMHHPAERPPLLQKALEKMARLDKRVQIERLFEGNQSCILGNRII